MDALSASLSPRRSLHLKSLLLVLSTRETFLPPNSDVSTIEEIFPLLLNTVPKTASTGRLRSNSLIITITCLFSSRVSAKSKTHIDSSPSKVSLICLRRVVLRFCQSSPSSSSPSRVSYNFIPIFHSRLEHPWRWNYLNHLEDLTGTSQLLRHHWWGTRSLL